MGTRNWSLHILYVCSVCTIYTKMHVVRDVFRGLAREKVSVCVCVSVPLVLCKCDRSSAKKLLQFPFAHDRMSNNTPIH